MFILETRMTRLRFLFQYGMGDGLMVIHTALYAKKINLEDLMPIYGQIGNQIIALTAGQRWTGVKSVRLTEIFNICDTCVYAPCFCDNEPENCVAYIERIGSSMYTEVQNEN